MNILLRLESAGLPSPGEGWEAVTPADGFWVHEMEREMEIEPQVISIMEKLDRVAFAEAKVYLHMNLSDDAYRPVFLEPTFLGELARFRVCLEIYRG